MSENINDQAIDEKILSIKDTLNQLGSSFYPSQRDTPELQSQGRCISSERICLDDSFPQQLDDIPPFSGSNDSSLIHYTESPSMDAIKRENSEFLTSPWLQRIIPINFDKDQVVTLEQRIGQKDELLTEMSRLQKELRDKLTDAQEKIPQLKDTISKQNNRIEELQKALEDKTEKEIRISKETTSKICALEDRINSLENCQSEFLKENDDLYQQLQIKDAEIRNLQEMVSEMQGRDQSRENEILLLQKERVALLREIETKAAITSQRSSPLKARNRSVSPHREPRGRSTHTQKQQEMAEVIRTLTKKSERSDSALQFVERVSSLMNKFNPNEKRPSLRRIWNWIKWLLEEYMCSKSSDLLINLQKVVGVHSAGELVSGVKKLKHENKKLMDKYIRETFGNFTNN